MTVSRYLSLVDLVVAVVVLVALALPPRSLDAADAYAADDTQRLRLALAQARSQLAPGDGRADWGHDARAAPRGGWRRQASGDRADTPLWGAWIQGVGEPAS